MPEWLRVCLGLCVLVIGSVGVFFVVRRLMRRFDAWLIGGRNRDA